MTREEYVQQCKDRAMKYYHQGDLQNAVTSMASDMGKREDTKVANVLVYLGMLHIINHDSEQVRRWIEGFR